MVPGIEGVTTAALSLALDAASLQHRVLAANVANANTPGYVPMRLRFAARIEGGAVRQATAATDPASMFAVRMSLQPAFDASGAAATVQPDQEVAAMSENALHYQALASALDKHFSILASAASDGKR
ncbi:flagellar basal body protein [Cupriavidus sp. SW-Y-13]|uniref:flagellar basal body rod protein FlgB n=1 Tax=Cupriavidus sp. SW-Y-13 TaxID=2653854 RepID=UPI001365E787|nr:flagellar basal body protein [Cupriavidus sp. SW-Y-13]MWL90529.1 flagellar basal body protein [Cupriavidus sp. SW-Y-13]